MKNVILSATDLNGTEIKKGVKTFEICFDHEPTKEEICALQSEACQWQNVKVLKLYPAVVNPEKQYSGKFWTLSFEVHEDDWLFWCGFCAGKKWGITAINGADWKIKRRNQIAEYLVQI